MLRCKASVFHVQIANRRGLMAGYDPDSLKAFWEYCEAFKGWARLLLVGNAAGLASSTRTGLVKPNRRMALAIWVICFLEWVRGLVARGFSALTA